MIKGDSRIATIIGEARSAQYRTAQLFHRELSKSYEVTYVHYTRVESGERFPEPGLLLAIAQLLELDQRRLLQLWAREQMPTDAAKAFFEDYRTDELPTIARDIEETYTFLDSHAPAMTKDRNIWEVACFIIHFQGAIKVTEPVLHEALKIPRKDLKRALNWLKRQSIVEERGGVFVSRRTYLHIPYRGTEFFDVRNYNFKNLSSKALESLSPQSLEDKSATRFTVLQRMSKDTVKLINNKLLALQNTLGQLPDEGTEFFTLCVISGNIGSISSDDSIDQVRKRK
jgi:hypothetical protein